MIWNENGLSGKRYAALRKRTKVLSLWRHLALPFTDWPNSTTRFGKHYAVKEDLFRPVAIFQVRDLSAPILSRDRNCPACPVCNESSEAARFRRNATETDCEPITVAPIRRRTVVAETGNRTGFRFSEPRGERARPRRPVLGSGSSLAGGTPALPNIAPTPSIDPAVLKKRCLQVNEGQQSEPN